MDDPGLPAAIGAAAAEAKPAAVPEADDESGLSELAKDDKSPTADVILEEAKRILADLMELSATPADKAGAADPGTTGR